MAATADSDSCLKSRPPSHIVLPKHGAPVPVAEPLPSQKDDLELVIVRKFVRAVGERFGRTLSAPTRGDRWPDFWTAEGADQVGIEVAEVVNPDHIAAKGYGVPQPVSVTKALWDINHPFRAIWLISPTAYEIPSFLESVWPTTDFTSTGT